MEAEFTIQRVFNAPPLTIWRAWTDPDLAVSWWHPRGVSTRPGSVEVDARVGGSYRYTMVSDSSGEEFPRGGRYIELVESERLVFTWGELGAEAAPVITVMLKEVDEGTEMTFHLRGLSGTPGDEWVYDGWDQALDGLAEGLPA